MTQHTIISNLKAIKALLEKGWCQDALALDSKGNEIDPENKHAVSFCIRGASKAVCLIPNANNYESIDYDTWRKTLLYIELGIKYVAHADLITAWNDHPTRKKEEVLALMDKAIFRAENDK